MLLRYKGGTITVWERAAALARRRPYAFSPFCDVPDGVAYRLLRNPRYEGMFEKVYPYTCELCGMPCMSKAGLSAHQRKHKKEMPSNIVADHLVVDGVDKPTQ